MYHSQQHRMQNCQFLYLRESFGYNRELFVCPSCVHRVAIGRLRVCVGSILAFYQIREENRAKLKISYSCGHRVSKSARYDATLRETTMYIFYLIIMHLVQKMRIRTNYGALYDLYLFPTMLLFWSKGTSRQ